MRRKRGYRKPGLRSFDSDRLRENAAMAFLQAGSPTEIECTPNTQPPDWPDHACCLNADNCVVEELPENG